MFFENEFELFKKRNLPADFLADTVPLRPPPPAPPASYWGAWFVNVENVVADLRLQIQSLGRENRLLRKKNEELECGPRQTTDSHVIEKARQSEEKIFELTLENMELVERLKQLEKENQSLRQFSREIKSLSAHGDKSLSQVKDQISQFRHFVFQWFSLEEKEVRQESEIQVREQMRALILKSAFETEAARENSNCQL